MKKAHVLFVFSAIATVSYCGDQNYVPPPPPPPSSSTTQQPNTTTASTTAKPTKPTTTVPPSPNTTTSATTTTTTSPTTTSTAAPPTPAPGPIPDPPKVSPETGSWTVNFTKPTNKTCIVSHIAIQVEVPYKRLDNKTKHAFVDVPANATVSGNCEKDDLNLMTLTWNKTNSITFTFERNNTTFNLSSIQISITPDNVTFPGYDGAQVISLYHQKSEFSTSLKKSYKCAKEQTFNLTSSAATNLTNPSGFLHISHTHLQAFHNATGKSFADAEDCEPFDTPDVVPIAVGCALAALVIIVLVAYLVGRRRSQARGYLSM